MSGNVGQEPSRSGVEEPLVSVGEAALDRMPALHQIFEKAAAAFTRTLGDYSEVTAALSLDGLEARRIVDIADAPSSRVFVYEALGLDAKLAACVDEGCRALAFEMLLGSNVVEWEPGRPSSALEDRIVGFAVEKLLAALSSALEPLAPVAFERAPLIEEAGVGALGQKSAVTILARLTLRSLEHAGEITLILPRAALDPFRAALSRLPGADGQANDQRWSENLYHNIVRADVKVEVRIEARAFTLGDVAQLEIGDVLRLPIAPTDPIRVVSEGRTLFWCTLGQKDGNYTVRLEEFSDERQSFIENILGV